MAGKTLSTEPTIDPTASVRESKLGAYIEVGARTILLEVPTAPAPIFPASLMTPSSLHGGASTTCISAMTSGSAMVR